MNLVHSTVTTVTKPCTKSSTQSTKAFDKRIFQSPKSHVIEHGTSNLKNVRKHIIESLMSEASAIFDFSCICLESKARQNQAKRNLRNSARFVSVAEKAWKIRLLHGDALGNSEISECLEVTQGFHNRMNYSELQGNHQGGYNIKRKHIDCK